MLRRIKFHIVTTSGVEGGLIWGWSRQLKPLATPKAQSTPIRYWLFHLDMHLFHCSMLARYMIEYMILARYMIEKVERRIIIFEFSLFQGSKQCVKLSILEVLCMPIIRVVYIYGANIYAT